MSYRDNVGMYRQNAIFQNVHHICCMDMDEYRIFKISRILKVNGHSFSRIFWDQIGDNFNVI